MSGDGGLLGGAIVKDCLVVVRNVVVDAPSMTQGLLCQSTALLKLWPQLLTLPVKEGKVP